ncbi:MAG: hypothetical protein EA344_11330, partial [Alkalicoccus sp.]
EDPAGRKHEEAENLLHGKTAGWKRNVSPAINSECFNIAFILNRLILYYTVYTGFLNKAMLKFEVIKIQ